MVQPRKFEEPEGYMSMKIALSAVIYGDKKFGIAMSTNGRLFLFDFGIDGTVAYDVDEMVKEAADLIEKMKKEKEEVRRRGE